MNQPNPLRTLPAPPSPEEAANSGAGVPSLTAEDQPGRSVQEALAAADVVMVNLSDVRRLGPETAIVWAAIQAGHVEYQDITAVTGIRRLDVRICWAHLSRAGYPLPQPTIHPNR